MRGYAYLYDNINRLKTSIYKRDAVISNAYSENLTYDKNGNIGSITRNGNGETATQIDALVYTYAGANTTNQLLKVVDNAPTASKGYGFIDSTTNSSDDYTYDANGNMTKDGNKNITAITYNHLNLPTTITFATTGNIVYLYNAEGQKVQKIVNETGKSAVTTDYLGGYQYVSALPKFFPTAEGYVEVSGSSYKYVYQYKDHLGNVRLSYDKNLSLQDEIQYYPFGLQQKRPTDVMVASNYKYKFQGQERQDELGLGWDSFKWRNYDPAIGRFMCIDPLAEKYSYQSPYNFAENRVVDGNELEGLEWVNAKNQQIYNPNANNGKGDYTKQATNMDRNIGNSLRTNTGQEQFNTLVNSDKPIQIDFNIKDTKADENGKMIPGETNHTDLLVGTDKSGKVEDVSFSKSIITVYARNINVLEQASNDGKTATSGDLYNTPISENLSFSDILGAILGHEIDHTKKENVLTMAKGGNAEATATKVSDKILDELKN